MTDFVGSLETLNDIGHEDNLSPPKCNLFANMLLLGELFLVFELLSSMYLTLLRNCKEKMQFCYF